MTLLKTTLLAATAALGLTTGALADPSNGWRGQGQHTGSIENQPLNLRALGQVQVQRFRNPTTGRNYTAVSQTGYRHGVGIVQSGNTNTARVVQNGANTNVIVNQQGNFNNSAVVIFGH